VIAGLGKEQPPIYLFEREENHSSLSVATLLKNNLTFFVHVVRFVRRESREEEKKLLLLNKADEGSGPKWGRLKNLFLDS